MFLVCHLKSLRKRAVRRHTTLSFSIFLKKTAYSGTLRLGGLRGLEPHVRVLASGYGSEGVCLGSTKTHTPSVQLTLVSTSTGLAQAQAVEVTEEARGNTETTTSRQRSKLAEGSQEGGKGREK